MTTGRKMITVLCPVYNEQDYVAGILEFFVRAEPAEKELFIIDGCSTDNTTDIVSRWMKDHKNIHLLSNPSKYVPFALNAGINGSTGDPVIRLDAHTLYDDDYFIKILETFDSKDADIVGGPMRAIGNTDFQRAVAYCTSTRFGVGDSSFHNDKAEGYVDSVYLGAWKRSVFTDVGMFDEDMVRNQDDEFHYRAKSKGKKIYLNPQIKSRYFPRKSFGKLFSQYFQYGLYKPLVIQKVSSEIKLRHLIPSFFVLYFLSLYVWWVILGAFAFAPAVLYLLLAIYFSLRNVKGYVSFFCRLCIYPVLHMSYGSGFLLGARFLFRKLK